MREANKEFDGTTAVKDAGKNLVLVGIVDENQTVQPFTVTSGTYYDEANATPNGNAGVAGDTAADSQALRAHTVRYAIQKNEGSGNYVLDNASYRNSRNSKEQ